MSKRLKFAILSHEIPPAISGQAIALYRLLQKYSPASYVLITRKNRGVQTYFTKKEKLLAKTIATGKELQVRHKLRIGDTLYGILIDFFLGIFQRMVRIFLILFKESCSFLICCSGDIYNIPAGAIASILLRRPFALYLFDDYIQQWTGNLRKAARIFEQILIRFARLIIVPNEALQLEYYFRYRIRAVVLRNPVEIPELDVIDTAPRLLNCDTKNIVYTGSIYHAHYDAFHNLLKAVRSLDRSDVVIHLFTPQSENELLKFNIAGPEVVYHKFIEIDSVIRVQREADILFLPLSFSSRIASVIRTSAPGKMGEYLASGRPILVHGPRNSYIVKYFSSHRCGEIVCDPKELPLKNAICRILEDRENARVLGNRARQRAIMDFSKNSMEKHFDNIIQRMTR